ncbi:hypothetical protein ACHQM5_026750 [Ranunculus cassubicifolius]
METTSVEISQATELLSNDTGVENPQVSELHSNDVVSEIHSNDVVSEHSNDVVSELHAKDVVSEPHSNDVGHQTEDLEPQLLKHEDAEMKCEMRDAEIKCEMRDEELRGILEVIAATGKFWHDWDTLKSLLSFRLKQVLAEYPESQMSHDQQSSSLGETYGELASRLLEALFSFTEGPPFTLQRLCEILLAARTVYPNLSKLALALEKNLLVTSTLSISTDPYPTSTIQKANEVEKSSPEHQPLVVQNGVVPVEAAVDEDEEMADAEEIALDEDDKEETIEEEETTTPVVNGSLEVEEEAAAAAARFDEKNASVQPSGESSPSRENLEVAAVNE